MSGIKNLAGQTIWYGASTIAARFLNYLLTPYLTGGVLLVANYGQMSLVYAAIPLLNVIFTYGFEIAENNFADKNVKLSVISNYDALISTALEHEYITQTQVESLSAWRVQPDQWGK